MTFTSGRPRAAPASADVLAPLIDHLRTEPSRTWSLIVTLFGDSLSPRGRAVWLGTVIEVFGALGIAEGVVRTAMSRLTADRLLAREKIGRNTYYRLGDDAIGAFARATDQIYRRRPPAWNGHFDLLVIDPDVAKDVADDAQSAGWGRLADTILIAPADGRTSPVRDAIRTQLSGPVNDLRQIARRAWPLADMALAYTRFISVFQPLREALADGVPFSPLEALVARTLLIHAWRRIVLRDPLLPSDLLAEDWPGTEARTLCAAIYAAILAPSEAWLDAHALGEDGVPLAARPEIVGTRFRD